MNNTAFIIDDEHYITELLADYVRKTPGLVLAGTTTDPVAALEIFNGPDAPALTFLDVHMPKLSGLELAGMIAQRTYVVLTTSFREHGPEAFEYGVRDYLLKPVSYERFLRCVQKFRTEDHQRLAVPDSFFVKSDIKGKLVRVFISSIQFVESELNYCNINLGSQNIKAYLTLSELLDKLPSSKFCRIHKSFIVNTDHVITLEHGQVRVSGQAVLPLGRNYRAGFLEQLSPVVMTSHRGEQTGD